MFESPLTSLHPTNVKWKLNFSALANHSRRRNSGHLPEYLLFWGSEAERLDQKWQYDLYSTAKESERLSRKDLQCRLINVLISICETLKPLWETRSSYRVEKQTKTYMQARPPPRNVILHKVASKLNKTGTTPDSQVRVDSWDVRVGDRRGKRRKPPLRNPFKRIGAPNVRVPVSLDNRYKEVCVVRD